jgi:hypothetical protein
LSPNLGVHRPLILAGHNPPQDFNGNEQNYQQANAHPFPLHEKLLQKGEKIEFQGSAPIVILLLIIHPLSIIVNSKA